MNSIPEYVFILFITTACMCFFLLLRAFRFHKRVFTFLLALFLTQGMVSFDNFYLDNNSFPPHILFLIMPSILLIISMFTIPSFRKLLEIVDYKFLLLIHILRIPIEVVLWQLSKSHTIPASMTFEGNNWDILSGLSAIAVYYFVYIKNNLNRNVLLFWNFICLALLLNVVVTGILSVPTSFQQLNFEQPNIAMLYFPFAWLPSFIVPAVLFSHIASIRNFLKTKS